MRLLIVDGRDNERRKLSKLLTTYRGDIIFDLLEAGDEKTAMTSFLNNHPDLILIHIADGQDSQKSLCEQVRLNEGKRHTGIIFLCDDTTDIDSLSVECLEAGADDFLKQGATPEELLARVRAVLRLKAMTDELRSANHKLKVLSMTDELSGLANMRAFQQRYGEVVRNCRAGDVSYGIIMMDIDHFKRVNDTSNHLMGSYVLSELGNIFRMSDIFQDTDLPARYGGDEFIVVCQDDNIETIIHKAESLRKVIEGNVFKRDGIEISVTSSLGIAYVHAGFSGPAEDVIKAADLMLYRSKECGRNRVSAMVLKQPIDVDKLGRENIVQGEIDKDESFEIIKSA